MKKAQSYEAILARLKEITGALDEGNKSLDEMMSLYKEGVELTKSARGILDSYKAQITQISSSSIEDRNDEE